jgi:hypothetical protein
MCIHWASKNWSRLVQRALLMYEQEHTQLRRSISFFFSMSIHRSRLHIPWYMFLYVATHNPHTWPTLVDSYWMSKKFILHMSQMFQVIYNECLNCSGFLVLQNDVELNGWVELRIEHQTNLVVIMSHMMNGSVQDMFCRLFFGGQNQIPSCPMSDE